MVATGCPLPSRSPRASRRSGHPGHRVQAGRRPLRLHRGNPDREDSARPCKRTIGRTQGPPPEDPLIATAGRLRRREPGRYPKLAMLTGAPDRAETGPRPLACEMTRNRVMDSTFPTCRAYASCDVALRASPSASCTTARVASRRVPCSSCGTTCGRSRASQRGVATLFGAHHAGVLAHLRRGLQSTASANVITLFREPATSGDRPCLPSRLAQAAAAAATSPRSTPGSRAPTAARTTAPPSARSARVRSTDTGLTPAPLWVSRNADFFTDSF